MNDNRKRGVSLPNKVHAVIGIDPGFSGASVAMKPSCPDVLSIVRHDNSTPRDIVMWFESMIHAYNIIWVEMEKVGAMPNNAARAAFKFGHSNGLLTAAAYMTRAPLEFVVPQKWQQAMRCLSKGDKNITKAAAQNLFPKLNVIHATADALLITEYGRRRCNSLIRK